MNIKYTAEPTAQLFHADNSFVRGIMGPVGCLPHETEYLTKDGWRPIGEYDVSSEELVAQYDMETSCVQYVKPLEFIVKPATKWVTLTGGGFRFVMSDDHYMPAVPEFGGEHIDVVATELADFTSAKDEGGSVRHLSLLSPRINESNGGRDGVVHTERVIIPSDGSVSATIEDSINGECKYCFTVPTGYFVIRQFGRTYISHNSGKSVACTIEVVARALKQTPAPDGVRYSRWVVIRNHYPELKSTTIKTWEDWIPPTICPVKWDTPINARLKITDIGDGTGIDLEVLFLALDKPQDVKKLLSLELTGGWINEAKEVDPAVLTMLTSRVGRYPSKAKMGGASYWSGIIMDTNPMDEDHWYYRLAEEDRPQGYRFYRQPGALIYTASKKYIPNPTAENISNLPNGHDYYMRQIGGKDHEWIKVYLMGEYGAVMDGKPVYPEYSDLSHCPDVDIKPLERSPLIASFDFGLCYSDDTEVLTENGWKFFKDVSENERVATRNTATNQIEYHVPKFKVDKPYRGKMLEWVSTEVNMCVTPEHIIPCRDDHKPDVLQWKSAEWLSQHNSGHWRVDLTSVSSDSTGFVDPLHFGMEASVFAKMMGIYLSEGCVYKQGNSHRITIYQNNKDPRIDEVLKATGLNWVYYDGKSKGWNVTNNELGAWLLKFGHAGEKRVPREIANMPASIILDFIDFYTIGDGHIRTRPNGSVEHTIFTISERMAADMQELAQKVGWNSSVRKVKPQRSVIVENGVERVIDNNGGYSIAFKKSAKTAGLHGRHFKEIDYDGRVYCLNVPYHTLYVRRGGRAHWNGNTPCCIIGQLSPRGQLVILDELVSDNMGIRQFANEIVVPYLSSHYPKFSIHCTGDPAGVQRAQSNESTCMDELKAAGLPTEPAWTNEFIARREAVAGFLNKMVDGQPAFVLSHKCRMLRKGFLGGYCYKRTQVSGGRYKDKPDKNEYSHPHDALQYLALYLTEQRSRALKSSARRHSATTHKSAPMDDVAGY